ncbi:MAG: cyclase family protein, partial [Bacteroidia bacterium]
ADAALLLAEMNVEHLLLDLPSVDREVDGGALAAHKAFWNYPENTRRNCTITEFIYVPNDVFDGAYLLNLQTAPIENDATPSRPVLYRILS